MPSSRGRKPSRIYVGSEPLPPVNPLVPVALAVVFVGVDTVRSFCAQHADVPVGSGPRVEFLERGLLWLFGGAAACGLAIVFRWVRGRREWGDVPLGFGIGACVFPYVMTCFLGFSRDGELNSAYADMHFLSLVLFGAVLLFASYLVLQFVVARLRSDRRSALALLAIPLVVLSFLAHVHAVFVGLEEPLDPTDLVIDDNSLTLRDELYHAGRQTLPARSGVYLYAEREGRPIVAVHARSARRQLRAPEYAYLDEDFVELDTGNPARYVKYQWIYDHVPDAVVSLGADASAARLHEFTRDLRERNALARDVSILSWKTSYPARFQGFERDKRWFDDPAMLLFQLDDGRPAWEVHVEHVDGEVLLHVPGKSWPLRAVLNGAASKARMSDATGRGATWYDEDKLPPLRLRIHPDVSMQEFVDAVVELRESTNAGWWFKMVIDDWVPSSEPASGDGAR
ncbi:MAG: hypothetical protein H6831_06010 [Planctomycetes bacterium]|nr:hypothetical protein [Planctomycetota bacterium]MCB9903946.1 hypothetical protein [Planctomycetota bacterium]